MRVFHGVIFLEDVEAAAGLHVRLEEGVAMLATPDDPELEDVVRDLAAALLGRAVTIGSVLPECGVANGVRVHGLPARA